MFFAYPDTKNDYVETHTFDKTITTNPTQVVDAFAGAGCEQSEWAGTIRDKIGGNYDNYLPYLLSDHVPIYFDYTDKGVVHRILFANNGSLLGRRGICDNSAHFKDITLDNLEEYRTKLVR